MAQVTLSVEADVSTWSSGIAAGAGNHLPIGAWGGADYRSAMRFPIPAGWSGFTSITSAVLSFYISDHSHVGVRDSAIYIRRQSVAAGLWTKSAGTQNCESGYSAGNNTQYDDITPVTADQYSFQSGSAANAKKSVNVTGIVRAYHDAGATKLVFVFDNVGGSDYTELWSDERSGYDATLVIDYLTNTPPTAPTPTAPGHVTTVVDDTPRLDWTHNDPQGDPQASAEVRLWDAAGTGLLATYPVAGSTSFYDLPALTRGASYWWDVRTADASGYGPYSEKWYFTVKANPVVTIDPTRYMEWYDQPYVRVRWAVAGGTQDTYRVQVPGAIPPYDTGVLAGPATDHLPPILIVNGSTFGVTVTITTADGLTATDTKYFTPRWGMTTHRRDLGSAPVGWGTPTVVNTMPAGASQPIQYGSSPTATAAPTAWFSTLSSVPFARYLFYRAWFIPSATAGPTLDAITIPANFTVASLDKWGTTRDVAVLAAPWRVDDGEYVYGSRSLAVTCDGTAKKVYSFAIKLRPDRSYILTGLMKSEGNSGAHFRLEDAAGNILQGGGMALPFGDVSSKVLTATTDWYTTVERDVNRYRTPVYVAGGEMTVYVVCAVSGVSGAKAWFDAIKLEESTVATPWSPGAVGAVIVDAGGVQVDRTRGGIFRLRGATGTPSSVVELGGNGLVFGGDVELSHAGAAGNVQLASLVPDTPATLTVRGSPVGQYEGGQLDLGGGNGEAGFALDVVQGASFRMHRLGLVLLGVSPSMLSTHSGQGLYFGGNAFPTPVAVGQQYYRMDLGLWFFWDGSRWLSSTVFEAHFPIALNVAANGAEGSFCVPSPDVRGGSGILWVQNQLAGFFVAVGGSTLSASHLWKIAFNARGSGGIVGFTTFTIDSGASNQWRRGTPGPYMPVNQVMDTSSNIYRYLYFEKTGTPGNLSAVCSYTYRIIG